ncbi:ABC transporter substrate-binding protein [Psychromicrobium sp. YIM B11713]|uniref:ABC transporter substrate-binding protein n=1 Tax=Psychromicrobium sp. YIM B11713 TaxID=3145233 RepID=UPI00374F148C
MPHTSGFNRRNFLLGGAALLCLSACGTASPQNTASQGASFTPVTLQNSGRTLTVTSLPQRIVSCYPSMTDLVIALGAADQLVGQAGTSYSVNDPEYADRASKIPRLSPNEMTTESLLSVAPDFVISEQEYHFDGKKLLTISDLEHQKVPVYVSQALWEQTQTKTSLEHAYQDISDVGRILGQQAKAEELIATLRNKVAETQVVIKGKPRRKVLIITLQGSNLYTHSGAMYEEVLKQAGADNVIDPGIVENGKVYAQTSAEYIAQKDPEFLVFVYQQQDSKDASEKFISERLSSLTAVKKNRVVAIQQSAFGGALASPKAVPGVAKQLYPELF